MLLALLAFRNAVAQTALLPEPDADHSAYRIDCEVFGWNKAFTEMGVLGSDVRRHPKGKHRGEMFLLVFDIGSITPKHNVHVLYITQADMPHDPLPLDDVRDKMWGIDWSYEHMWPRRPKRKHFRGAMKIETLAEVEEIGPTICRPVIGFLLSYKGRVRYQPHQAMKMKASCANLRMTDYRTYWAKKDLGAVMIRYDYSPNDHEQSIRFPLSVAWSLGVPLRIRLRTAGSLKAPATMTVRKQLARYGKVEIEADAADVPSSGGVRVDYGADRRTLAKRLATALGGEVGEQTSAADIVVSLGEDEGKVVGDRSAVIQRQGGPSIGPADTGDGKPKQLKSTYLEDFAP